MSEKKKVDAFLNWLVVMTFLLMPFLLAVGVPVLEHLLGPKP